MTVVERIRRETPAGQHELAYDLEEASADNLETYEALWQYPKELRSAGIAQERCDRLIGPDDEEHGQPLMISEYGTWFSQSKSPVYFSCECTAE